MFQMQKLYSRMTWKADCGGLTGKEIEGSSYNLILYRTVILEFLG
jgi:hypothetical protein